MADERLLCWRGIEGQLVLVHTAVNTMEMAIEVPLSDATQVGVSRVLMVGHLDLG